MKNLLGSIFPMDTRLVSPIVLAVLVGLPAIVSAQDEQVDELLVTATRRAETIQDVPYNISAMSGEQLESARVFSLADLSRTIPGIAFSDLGVRSGGVNNQLILRGVNTNAQGSVGAFLSNLNPAGVSTYFDNTPLFTNLRISDLERVEVLRGPQGTLYGANSIGGTLRFIFNKPDTEEFLAKIDTAISSTEDADDLNYSLDGVVNIPLTSMTAFRISAGYNETAGFVDGNALAVGGIDSTQVANPADPFGSTLLTETREDTDDADQWYLRASLLWEFSDRFQAQLTYHRQEDDADGFSYQTNENVPGAQERTHSQYFNSPLSRDVDLISLDLEFDLGFARLESSTAYTNNEDTNAGDLTGIAVLNDVATGGFAFGGFLQGTNASLSGFFEDKREVETITQEIRLISQGEGKWDWVAGFYYEDIEANSFESVFVPGFANFANTPGYSGLPGNPFAGFGLPPFLSFANIIAGPPTFVSQAAVDEELYFTLGREETIEDIAVYGELTYHITDAWQITGGARIFWNENDNRLISTFPLFGAIAAEDGMDPTGLNTASGGSDVDDEVFKVNTSYEFSDDLKVYATWSEGFRRGGGNAFPTAGFAAESPEELIYDPDTVTNYEIGVKGGLFDTLDYTAAIFLIDWDSPQISGFFTPGGFPAVFNAEEARTQGVELEGQWAVTDELQLSFGYTYTDAELTADFASTPGPSDMGVPDIEGSDGSRLPGVPEDVATWALDYERPVNFLGDSLIHLRVDGSYRSDVVTATSPNLPQFAELGGFSIWNASATWSNEQWRVGVFVRNIGDEEGITQVVRDFPFRSIDSLDFISRPRTFGVAASYSF